MERLEMHGLRFTALAVTIALALLVVLIFLLTGHRGGM